LASCTAQALVPYMCPPGKLTDGWGNAYGDAGVVRFAPFQLADALFGFELAQRNIGDALLSRPSSWPEVLPNRYSILSAILNLPRCRSRRRSLSLLVR